MTTMQAAVIREHGGPDVLEVTAIDCPVPGPGEIRVRVAACALNHLDIFVRRGMPGVHLPLPHVSGGDVTGWVDAAGDEQGSTLVGQSILVDPLIDNHALGEDQWGGLAEYVVVPVENAIPIDDSPDALRTMAALPIAYGTAYRMLFSRAKLRSGETAAILGASGGVGVACVQLAKRARARTIACSASDSKLAGLRGIGADETVNTATSDFSREIWRLTGKQGVDVMVDYNGKDSWPGSIRATRLGGRIVTCGATTGFEAVTDLRYVWTRELNILGSDGWSREDLNALVTMVQSEELQPIIHAILPLSRVHEAIAELEERRALGKVIVIPDAVWQRVA